jgi:acetolactate synthase-1/2/3 large subunit
MSDFTVAKYLSFFLQEKGIDSVFQLSGGMITQLIDAISIDNRTTVHSLFHEQSCAFAVSAFGRINKTPSVAFATSGPGATNLITGIGDCYYDSIPAIFITGQVNTFELKGISNIRQLGFQETDIVSMVKPITKMAIQLNENHNLPELLENLYQTSVSGRPGPVLLDIPMNLQRAMVQLPSQTTRKTTENPRIIDISAVIELLQSSKKPLIWAGNGIHTSNSEAEFNEFINITQIPSVLTLHGVDLLPHENPWRVGMIGSYGNRWANKCVKEADTILFLGARIDIRQTGANLEIFEGKNTIRIDCDIAELNNRVSANLMLNASVKSFLNSYLQINPRLNIDSTWISDIQKLKNEFPVEKEIKLEPNEVGPFEILRSISRVNKSNTIYTVDVGAHQMWAAQSLEFKPLDRFLTSGGMGAMGFSIPAAIGAIIARPKTPVVVIVGDGSFQMNIQELQYISNQKLNIKILVINNECLGMIRQFQDSYMNGRYFGTKWGYSVPNICSVTNAYGIDAKSATEFLNTDLAAQWLLDGQAPKLLEFKMRSNIDVFPKIAFGQTMDKMEPDFSPNDIEST